MSSVSWAGIFFFFHFILGWMFVFDVIDSEDEYNTVKRLILSKGEWNTFQIR